MAIKAQSVAIISGDLVGSTRQSPDWIDRALDDIRKSAAVIASWVDEENLHFTRFRGDGWQILVSNPKLVLRAAITIYASLKAQPSGADTRMSLGLGDMAAWHGPDLSSATGSAFVASGQGLDAMKEDRRIVISGPGAQPLHKGMIVLMDDLIQGWSREQAEAISFMLGPSTPTQRDLAEQLGISPQATHARLKSARMGTVRQALTHWESAWDNRYD